MAKPLLASFFFSLLFCAHPPAFAQNKSQSQQTNSPEVSKEIVEKLNENIFKYAIIGVVNKGTESDLEILSAPYQKIYISRGFTLEHYKDCNLTLRNDKGLIVDSQIRGFGKTSSDL